MVELGIDRRLALGARVLACRQQSPRLGQVELQLLLWSGGVVARIAEFAIRFVPDLGEAERGLDGVSECFGRVSSVVAPVRVDFSDSRS